MIVIKGRLYLCRKSRPVPGQSVEVRLQADKRLLLEELRPLLDPDGVEGADWYYLGDVVSGAVAHAEGKLLSQVFQMIRSGRVNAIVLVDETRWARDLEAYGKLLAYGEQYKVRVYTRAKCSDLTCYELWKGSSRKEFMIQAMVSAVEFETTNERFDRAREHAYPIDAQNDSRTAKDYDGAGHHPTGQVGLGYIWDKKFKKVRPHREDYIEYVVEGDEEIPIIQEAVPCPDYIAPGSEFPSAKTWYDIVGRILELGFLYGGDVIHGIIKTETGVSITPFRINYILRNPFYGGRPTSKEYVVKDAETKRRIKMKRERPVYTVGNYDTHLTWEQWERLQAAITERQNIGVHGNGVAWASNIVYCACGQPYQGAGKHYKCRGKAHAGAAKGTVAGKLFPSKVLPGWEETRTCGTVTKEKIHEVVEGHVRAALTNPDFLTWLDEYEASALEVSSERTTVEVEIKQVTTQLCEARQERELNLNLYTRGTIKEEELDRRLPGVDRRIAGLEAHLSSLERSLNAPDVSEATCSLLRRAASIPFDVLWHDPDLLSDREKGLVARALIDHIDLTGKWQRKVFSPPTWTGLIPADAPCGPNKEEVDWKVKRRRPRRKKKENEE